MITVLNYLSSKLDSEPAYLRRTSKIIQDKDQGHGHEREDGFLSETEKSALNSCQNSTTSTQGVPILT